MNIVKRILNRISIYRAKNIVLVLCLCIFVFASVLGFYIDTIWSGYERAFADTDGTTVWIETKGQQQDIQEAVLQKIEQIPHITGYTCGMNVDVAFDALKQANEIYENSSQAVLSGNTDTAAAEDFAFGRNKLKEGVFPGRGKNDILIEQKFAEQNTLKIGSTLTLYDTESGEGMVFDVCGIFESEYSASERFYADFDAVVKGYHLDYAKNRYTFNVDDYKNMKNVKKGMETILNGNNRYICNDSISNAAFGLSAFSGSLESIKNILINISYLSGSVIIFCISFLWMRDHIKDAGIYIALGKEKKDILLEFLLEILSISVCTTMISSIVTYKLVERYKSIWMKIILHYINPLGEFQKIDEQMLAEKIPWSVLEKTNVLILGIVCIASLCAGSIIISYTNRQLLLTENE